MINPESPSDDLDTVSRSVHPHRETVSNIVDTNTQELMQEWNQVCSYMSMFPNSSKFPLVCNWNNSQESSYMAIFSMHIVCHHYIVNQLLLGSPFWVSLATTLRIRLLFIPLPCGSAESALVCR